MARYFITMVIALPLVACSGPKETAVLGGATTLPTAVPTAVPTTPTTAASGVDGSWRHWDGYRFDWSMAVETRADGRVVSYSERQLWSGTIVTGQWMVMREYGGYWEGTTYLKYPNGCIDEMYTMWKPAGTGKLNVSVACQDCDCGLIPSNMWSAFTMYR